MAIAALSSKAEGSIIKLKENGALVEFIVAKHNYESGLNGAGRTLVVRRYLNLNWGMSWGSCGPGNGYLRADNTISKWLTSTYKSMLDPTIQSAMGTTKFYSNTPNSVDDGNTMIRGTGDRCAFVLSTTEIGASNGNEGTALPQAVRDAIKVAYYQGSSNAGSWWTRTCSTNGYGGINPFYVGYNGLAGTNGSGGTTVRPAFTLPAAMYINDSTGTVTANTAPTVPSSITIPNAINGGTTITVKWGSSSDAEGNFSGYKVEKSTNGGSSWSQIYQGGALQTNDNVAFGTASVMYRVRAYDAAGLHSGYRTSGQVTVVNNTAPSAPSSINVPLTVHGGKTLVVTWGAAKDSEGNLSGYALERQVDGGSWSQVYRGNALTYTDTITKGWRSVAYRVRAYDAYTAYSGYTTSQTRTVINNTAPTIACDAAEDMGTVSEGFAIPYSVDDVDGNAVTVTEKIDGTVIRTFTATLGGTYSFDVTGETFMRVLNGPHTATVTASDGEASTARTLKFSKLVTSAAVCLSEPMDADAPITLAAISVSGYIPADAAYKVEVTNNARDDGPVWEDCTTEVKNGVNHVFSNQTAANGPSFGLRVTVSRGESQEAGYISSIQGGFQ